MDDPKKRSRSGSVEISSPYLAPKLEKRPSRIAARLQMYVEMRGMKIRGRTFRRV